MSAQRDRDEFISIMAKEGVSVDVARNLLSAEKTLHRIAELQCSSEAADRDRVKCPGDYAPGECLCRDYNGQGDESGGFQHVTLPRINVQEAKLQARVEKLCKAHNLGAMFNGDPRGPALLLKVPSGRTTDMGRRGVAVP